MQTPSSSPAFKLNRTDLWKIARGGLVVLAGALLTYVMDTIPYVDFGSYTPLVVSMSSSLIEAIRRYLVDYTIVK